jgi:two-component system LytT family response regulator
VNADSPIGNEQAVSHLVDRISTMVRDTMVATAPRRIVAIRDGKHHFIAQAEIDSLEADRNYVNIRAGEESYTLRWTMLQAEATLDPAQFLRVHRSVIVNLQRVQNMERGLHGVYVITLANGQRFTSGRAYRQKIQAHLRNGR